MMKLLCMLAMPAAAFVLQPRLDSTVTMQLAQGDKVPMDGEFMVLADGPEKLPYSDVFKGKSVVVFGIPGALTPTCTEKQLPGFVAKVDDFKAKGVDTVACLAVNGARANEDTDRIAPQIPSS